MSRTVDALLDLYSQVSELSASPVAPSSEEVKLLAEEVASKHKLDERGRAHVDALVAAYVEIYTDEQGAA